MREIKFRVFDQGTKKMYYPTEENDLMLLIGDSGYISVQNHSGYNINTDKYKDLCIVNSLDHKLILSEFTGLKDKNLKEIYEGDILSVCNGSINLTQWMDKPYVVKYVLNKGFDICMFCWDKEGNSLMDSTHWCEVIGNIYEHSELIEKID